MVKGRFDKAPHITYREEGKVWSIHFGRDWQSIPYMGKVFESAMHTCWLAFLLKVL
jgi:hypothetical protein